MKRVLYICPNGYLGGAENFVLNVCKLHKDGNKFSPTILFFTDGQACEVAQSFGIETYILKQKFRLLNPIRLVKASYEIHVYFKKEDFSLIHLTMPYSVIVCFLTMILSRAKKVWFQHGPVGGKLDKLAAFLPVDAILFNSSFTKEKHLNSTPCFTKKTHVLPLGVEIPGPLIKKSDQNLNLLCVGRICKGKNQLGVIKGLHRILIKSPNLKDHVKLKVIGSASSRQDKVYAREIKDYVKKHGLEEVIQFIGQQKKMRSFYQDANILIHSPEKPEAFGLVIAEAMSFNVTVVASPKGGSSDLLPDEDYAYIVKSPEKLAPKLEEAIHDHLNPERFNSITLKRKKSYDFIKSSFSHFNMIQELEAFYDKVLDS